MLGFCELVTCFQLPKWRAAKAERAAKIDVPNAGGTDVGAKQGSAAYAWSIIRADTKIREALMAESNQKLREGLLNGSVKIRYREVHPDNAGHIKATEFIIDTSKLDIAGCLF